MRGNRSFDCILLENQQSVFQTRRVNFVQESVSFQKVVTWVFENFETWNFSFLKFGVGKQKQSVGGDSVHFSESPEWFWEAGVSQLLSVKR